MSLRTFGRLASILALSAALLGSTAFAAPAPANDQDQACCKTGNPGGCTQGTPEAVEALCDDDDFVNPGFCNDDQFCVSRTTTFGVPSVSDWGLLVLAVLMLLVGAHLVRRNVQLNEPTVAG